MGEHSPLPTFVYAIDSQSFSAKVTLSSALVLRETARFYLIDGKYPAFNYRTRVEKVTAHLTPEAAWNSFIEWQRARKKHVENTLNIEREKLVLAERELAKLVRAEATHA